MTVELPAGSEVVLRIAQACAGLAHPPVLVGGWTPYLLIKQPSRRYLGTLDVDLALNWILDDPDHGGEFERRMIAIGACPKLPSGSSDRSPIGIFRAEEPQKGLRSSSFWQRSRMKGPRSKFRLVERNP